LGSKRVYISGDTEDIPEMRDLKDIDLAFICMNLPYTMTVKQAAEAVLAFKPKIVYPYHYRGQNGKSDISTFKQLVNDHDKSIKVVIRDWYLSK
jgi:L-ascorbate metabolism protein UlaG (beta-lactamase superfamily)